MIFLRGDSLTNLELSLLSDFVRIAWFSEPVLGNACFDQFLIRSYVCVIRLQPRYFCYSLNKLARIRKEV